MSRPRPKQSMPPSGVTPVGANVGTDATPAQQNKTIPAFRIPHPRPPLAHQSSPLVLHPPTHHALA